MPGRLAHLCEKFSQHRTLYHHMAANVGVDLDEAAARDPEDHRAAFLACARCGRTGACRAWLEQGHPDLPLFCNARDAFMRLDAGRRARRRAAHAGAMQIA